jgi:hypothetical protein
VLHQKFGNGNVVLVDGNKLTIAFDKAGEKRVVWGSRFHKAVVPAAGSALRAARVQAPAGTQP